MPALIPILVVDIQSPLWQLGMLVSIYLFAGAIGQAPAGVLADRVDRRYLLTPSIAMMAIGYLIVAISKLVGSKLSLLVFLEYSFTGTYQVMFVGMFIAGLGFSVIHPVGYPIITNNIRQKNKGKVLGMWGSSSKVGDMVAPLIVAALTLWTSWEFVLILMAVVGLVFAVGLFFYLSKSQLDTRPPETKPEKQKGRWRANPRAFLFPIGVMLLFFFFSLFTIQGLATYTPVIVTEQFGFTFSIGNLDIETESVANIYFAILLVSGAVSQLIIGGLSDRYDHRGILIALFLIVAVCIFVLIHVPLGPFTLFLTLFVTGGAIFGMIPARDAIVSDISPDGYEGRTFGYLWSVALLLGSTYPTLIGYVIDEFSIRTALYLMIGTAILAVLSITLLYSQWVYKTNTEARPTD